MSLELERDELKAILDVMEIVAEHAWLQPNEIDLKFKISRHLDGTGAGSNDD